MLDAVDGDAWVAARRRGRFGQASLAARGIVAKGSALLSERAQVSTAAFLILAAFAIRGWQFGDPLVHVDEDFYLLVGDRMLHGAVPFVDIWDRKPVGLFLIYAAIRLLGGDGIVQYQVVATLFAAGTAIIVWRIASRIASQMGAIGAGLLYLLLLGTAGGTGGQAPVFYNLFMAGAALALVDVVFDPETTRAKLRLRGAIAMVLIGLAMQVKYSVVFEGLCFGLLLLHRARKIDHKPGALAADASLWAGLALMPTVLALLGFAWIGHLPEFMQANFLSILDRASEPAPVLLGRLGKALLIEAAPAVVIFLTWKLAPWRQFDPGAVAIRFVFAWLAAAVFGYLIFGSYFTHYLLPLAPPVALACAPLFSHRPRQIGRIALGLLLAAGSIAYGIIVWQNYRTKQGAEGLEEIAATIRPHLTGCVYLYDGEIILYHKLNSCLLTRYPFPTHLNLTREAKAIGVEPLAEIRRIFALRPSVVVDTVNASEATESAVANELARGILQRDYRPVGVFRRGKSVITVYALLGGNAQTGGAGQVVPADPVR